MDMTMASANLLRTTMIDDAGGNGSSMSRQSHCPLSYDYDTATGMISPLTLLKRGATNNTATPSSTSSSLDHGDGGGCLPQQHHHEHPEQHTFSQSQKRHYNKLKTCQAREKMKRYFDNSKLLNDDERYQHHVIPRFDIQELTLGKILGSGGFGTVVEIKSIDIYELPQAIEDVDDDIRHNHLKSSTIELGQSTDHPRRRKSFGFLHSLRRDYNRLTHYHSDSGGGRQSMVMKLGNFDATTLSKGTEEDARPTRRGCQPAATNFSFLAWRDSAPGEEGNDAVLQEEVELRSCNPSHDTSNNVVSEDCRVGAHNDARTRAYYQVTATREGESSYAIKLISPSIVENDFKMFIQAAIDMARETYFLSVMNHPNILKLRAVGQEDMFSPRYFLVLDRLHETLSDRIDGTWKKQQDHLEHSIFHLHKSTKLQHLWEERIRVMRDLAGALCYMHDLKIIYRDVKPDNIGFDSQWNVKLFDFGLAREVREEDDGSDGTYKLTPNTGSIRYIAPENANSWPYNYLADCYSFGILLWEVTALERPYAHLTPKDIRDMVITWGERPKIKEGWSARVVALMKSAWDAHYSKRPTMKEIEAELELELSH